MSLRWRKEVRRTGPDSVFQVKLGYDLVRDGLVIACIRHFRGTDKFHWYTLRALPWLPAVSSINVQVAELATAKRQLAEYVRAHATKAGVDLAEAAK